MPSSACCASANPSANAVSSAQTLETPIEPGSVQLTVNPPESLEERLRARSRELHKRTQQVLATVEEGAGRGEAERALERLVGGLGDEHEVRLREVAAQASRAPLEVTARPTTRKLLEEVLDQVLLRQLLDHLNLLESDGHLARDGPAELDAGASSATRRPISSPFASQRHGDSRAAAAAASSGRAPRDRASPGVSGSGSLGDARSSSSLAGSRRYT